MLEVKLLNERFIELESTVAFMINLNWCALIPKNSCTVCYMYVPNIIHANSLYR